MPDPSPERYKTPEQILRRMRADLVRGNSFTICMREGDIGLLLEWIKINKPDLEREVTVTGKTVRMYPEVIMFDATNNTAVELRQQVQQLQHRYDKQLKERVRIQEIIVVWKNVSELFSKMGLTPNSISEAAETFTSLGRYSQSIYLLPENFNVGTQYNELPSRVRAALGNTAITHRLPELNSNAIHHPSVVPRVE